MYSSSEAFRGKEAERKTSERSPENIQQVLSKKKEHLPGYSMRATSSTHESTESCSISQLHEMHRACSWGISSLYL